MKKQIMSISAIGLMVLASSCAKNEVAPDAPFGVNPDQISFRSSVGSTKANEFNLESVKSGFNVIALDKANAYLPGFADPASNNVEYSFGVTSAGVWDWANSAERGKKLWPKDAVTYPLTFFAAYPKTDAIKKSTTTMTASVISNMTNNSTFQYNTYYQGMPIAFDGAKVSVDELGALSTAAEKPASGFADLKFKHIMSNMAFKINLPTGFKAYIQSIKIANVNKSGRTYDYKTGLWQAEPTYVDATNLTHFTHYDGAAQEITKDASVVNGLTDGDGGFNTLKLMPQTKVLKWALGDEKTPAINTFRADVAAWKASLTGGVVDAAAITKWHNSNTAAKGMMDSKGWKGARIEIIYILVDETAGAGNEKAVVGRKSGVQGAVADAFVRVGYVLDLNTLNVDKGWEATKRYTFEIPLGSAGASNGVLLDPEYKDGTGGSTDKPVDNPAEVDPGKPLKDNIIQFNVTVEDWADSNVAIN